MPTKLVKVKYTGADDFQVNWGSCDDPRPVLKEGETYHILVREVHSWHTKLTLCEYPHLQFNSASFEEVGD